MFGQPQSRRQQRLGRSPQIVRQHEGGDENGGGAQEHGQEADLGGTVVERGVARSGGLGLGDDEGGDDADTHGHRHACVGPEPGRARVGVLAADHSGQIERPGAGHQHADAVAGDIGGRHHRLQFHARRLDAVGVYDDVLGRRRKAERAGGRRHQHEIGLGIRRGHQQDR